jgi:beta-galactosidase
LLVGACCVASALAQTPPRERTSFNAGWRFTKDDPEGVGDKLSYTNIKAWVAATGAEFLKEPQATTRPEGNLGEDVAYTKADFDDSRWRAVNLPHDWGIEGPFKQEYPGETGKLPWWGVGWYRKHFSLPATDEGRRVYLDVDGAMAYANVWLNGQYIGGWPFGYASWRLDLTPHIKFGAENVLAIRLDNPPESSRWYPGGGIYRNVWLVKTPQVHVAHWGTQVSTFTLKGGNASPDTVKVRVGVENHLQTGTVIAVNSELFELKSDGNRGKSVASLKTDGLSVAAGKTVSLDQNISVEEPRLWSIEDPNRYVIVTSLEQNGNLVDRYETPFGFRTIQFTSTKGFVLNGKRVPLYGVCNHHDLGALGSAINTRAMERQLEILKEMGCNAIRTSHNPPAPELLDLCDRMGFVVMDEAFDCWARRKKRNDYHLLFPDWHEKDLRALVRRDRNHPSVVLWSTGNEMPDQARPEGIELSRRLTAIMHEEDSTRPVSAGCNHEVAGFNGFQNTLDVFGYNYKPHLYSDFHKTNALIPLFASETASTISSRGEYFFPVVEDKLQGKADFQMSSYDIYAPRWATTPDTEFKGQDEHPFVAGEFVWTGFDYLGEPTPYNADLSNLINYSDPADKARAEKELQEVGRIRTPSRSSYFGIIDLAGFRKDRFYIYQARWRPELRMAHILPHWNWPGREGEVTPVHVYTSGDEAELFLNGKSLGRKKKGQLEYRLRWDDVKYQPGTLKVVAYNGGGKWQTAEMKTTGPAIKITMEADRNRIAADGRDLSFVTVSIADKSGLTVPRSKNRIRFSVEGPGEIVATDNGDPTSFESFQSPERNAFNGLALVIVRAKSGQPGAITLKAEADGLKGATVRVRSY